MNGVFEEFAFGMTQRGTKQIFLRYLVLEGGGGGKGLLCPPPGLIFGPLRMYRSPLKLMIGGTVQFTLVFY